MTSMPSMPTCLVQQEATKEKLVGRGERLQSRVNEAVLTLCPSRAQSSLCTAPSGAIAPKKGNLVRSWSHGGLEGAEARPVSQGALTAVRISLARTEYILSHCFHPTCSVLQQNPHCPIIHPQPISTPPRHGIGRTLRLALGELDRPDPPVIVRTRYTALSGRSAK